MAFWIIKGMGAAYLLYLALQAVLSPSKVVVGSAASPEAPSVAFHQTFFLACVFVTVALCTDTVYVLMAAALAPVLQCHPHSLRAPAAEFWYVDRLQDEPRNGVAEVHVHPLEGRSVRLTLTRPF